MSHSNARFPRIAAQKKRSNASTILHWNVWLPLVLLLFAVQLFAREKDTTPYGVGLIVNVPYPVNEVTQVVQDVVQNGIIRGTKEYNKDEYVSGAEAATSTKAFEAWNEGGQIFYKVRLNCVDPRNFKNSQDVGTLAVRYVVQPQGEKNTILKIDARFVEDYRKVSHPSNGSVESAEFKDIRDRLETIEAMKNQAIEFQKEHQTRSSSSKSEAQLADASEPAATGTTAADTKNSVAETASAGGNLESGAPQTLAERVHSLRQQVERVVKAPGAPLKSAPFHTASVLQPLPAGTEVLIVITTPYWLGVETHDGQHGWILRDELELVP